MKQFLKESYVDNTKKALIKKHGEDHEERITTGVNQVASFWRRKDGTPKEFRAFCLKQFVSDTDDLDVLFNRFQDHLEKMFGYFHEIYLDFNAPMEDRRYEQMSADEIFATYDPFTHFSDDCFKNKIAFLALLNFEVDTLEDQITKGESWTRRRWAESRLMGYFTDQVPASVGQKISMVEVVASDYINKYNFFIRRIIVNGKQVFVDDLELISHWGLRDHLKMLYDKEGSLEAQRTIYRVMDRIVRQTVPQRVINNPDEEWDPFVVNKKDKPEPNTRYKYLLDVFRAVKEEDEFYESDETHKTFVSRKFNMELEIPEETVEEWLIQFLSSPVAKKVGELISARLGRPLEAFDFWYKFKQKREMEVLDTAVRELYPTLEHLKEAFSNILVDMGFRDDLACKIADNIELDPARSGGHATGCMWRGGRNRLRVRFLREDGKFIPNYDGFNTFMHEFGHGVEGYFSVQEMDYNILNGTPNNAFTEALAFVFQEKDLYMLGVKEERDELTDALEIVDLFWSTFEMAGVSLVDMNIWRWMYKHPNATATELKKATIKIANKTWNDYFAPIFGIKNQPILAIYSHIIQHNLYMPYYFIGYLIQHQIQEHLKDKDLAEEVERMFAIGSITPNLWMKKATGSSISTKTLLASTRKALKTLK